MTKITTEEDRHEEFAKRIFNGIWELLEKTDRSPEEDEEMLLSAFASAYHWKQIGTAVHFQRAYWMISKVYQALGKAEPALEWAQKCADISEKRTSAMRDFDLAYAEEALARSFALAGQFELAKKHYQQAAGLASKIQDPEDQQIFQADFEGGDWFGLRPEK